MGKLSSKRKDVVLLALVILVLAAAVFERHQLRRAFKRKSVPRGNVLHLVFQSQALGRQAGYFAYLPPGFDSSGRTRYPVLYLLHGLFRKESAYVNRVDADLEADRLLAEKKIAPMILVMPEGDESFYINRQGDQGRNWEDFIVKDLIAEVDRRFPAIPDRNGRGIGGFSMGGFGAMRLAILHRDLYSSASSEYGAFQLEPSSMPWLSAKLKQAFGNDPENFRAQSPLQLIESANLREGELAIYVDAGEDDAWALDEQAREFSRRLTARGIVHTFQIFPGNHTDGYLREHLAGVLEFHSKNFSAR